MTTFLVVLFAVIFISLCLYLKYCGNFKDCMKRMSEAMKQAKKPDNYLGDE